MLNNNYVETVENEYANLENTNDGFERLMQDIKDAEEEVDTITTFISIGKPLSDKQDLVTSLEMIEKKLYFNTYIRVNDLYSLWIDYPIDMSKYNSLEELCDDLKNHFEYNYIVGMNERELHCSDEDYHEDDEV